jgi:excisionase family DNA binding protein
MSDQNDNALAPNLDTVVQAAPDFTGNQVRLAPLPRLLLTPTEAATVLRISPRLLWSKTKSGEIPCLRIGRTVRYSTTSLQEWIDRAAEK